MPPPLVENRDWFTVTFCSCPEWAESMGVVRTVGGMVAVTLETGGVTSIGYRGLKIPGYMYTHL